MLLTWYQVYAHSMQLSLKVAFFTLFDDSLAFSKSVSRLGLNFHPIVLQDEMPRIILMNINISGTWLLVEIIFEA